MCAERQRIFYGRQLKTMSYKIPFLAFLLCWPVLLLAQGTSLPANTWVHVTADGLPGQVIGWERLQYVGNHKACMYGGFHTTTSEQNTGVVCYDFQANRWDLLSYNSGVHDEHHADAGHVNGSSGSDSTAQVLVTKMTSAQADETGFEWQIDVRGITGRKTLFPFTGPWNPNGYGAYDQTDHVLVTVDPFGNTGTTECSIATSTVAGTGTCAVVTNQCPGVSSVGTTCLNNGAMDWDSSDGNMYAFGGTSQGNNCDNSSGASNTVFRYVHSSHTWSALSVSGGPPPARSCPGWVYDSVNNKFILFAGANNTPSYFIDTWIFDPVALTWTQLSPSGTLPSSSTELTQQRTIFDPDDNVVIAAFSAPGVTNNYNAASYNNFPASLWFFRYAGTGPNIGSAPRNYTQPSGGFNAQLNLSTGCGSAAAAGNCTPGNFVQSGWAFDPAGCTDGTDLYAEWAELGTPFDTSNRQYPHAYLKKLTGAAGFLPSSGAYNAISVDSGYAEKPSCAWINSTLWEAHIEAPSNQSANPVVKVQSYNSGTATWSGGAISPTNYIYAKVLGVGSTVTLCTIRDSNASSPHPHYLYVGSWASNTFSPYGSSPNYINRLGSGTFADSCSLATDGTNVFVAFEEFTRGAGGLGPAGSGSTTNSQIFVTEWNGTSFVQLGGALNNNSSTGWAESPSISYVNGEPDVCFTERSQTGSPNLFCKRWNGSSWITLGSGAMNKWPNLGWTFGPSTATDGTNLYVAWPEEVPADFTRGYAAKWDGTVWTYFGSQINHSVNGSVQHVEAVWLSASSTLKLVWSELVYGTAQEVFTITAPTSTALNESLTIQEALIPGAFSGVARTNDPVNSGIPIPDSAGIVCGGALNSCPTLGLSGSPTYQQFRCLAQWPSGNCKWVLVDTTASLSAGGTNTSYVLANGSGNAGGPNLATDNGTTITVATGAATYTVKKANFNVFDSVVVGSTTIVSSGTSTGLTLNGPLFSQGYPNNTACGACTTPYTSSNDSASTCVIEENGPARAALKCTGSLKDSGADVYMTFTVREFFYANQPYAKVQVELQNAANSTSGTTDTFQSANKGFSTFGISLVLSPSMSSYAFGGPSSTISGTISGSAYLYEGYVDAYQPGGGYPDSYDSAIWVSPVPRIVTNGTCNGGVGWCYPDTTQSGEGWKVVNNGSTVASGNRSSYPIGWGDVTGSGGVGVIAGLYQISAFWPASIEFNSGGATLFYGINPSEVSGPSGAPAPYYLAWPQHQIRDVYFWPHASALGSPQNSFLGLQYPLIAHADDSAYNNAGVFQYPLLSSSAESAYYNALCPSGLATGCTGTNGPAIQACCMPDRSTPNTGQEETTIRAPRYIYWGAGSSDNQSDLRLSDLYRWLTQGQTGRWTYAKWFYRYVSEQAIPRSDGFSWSSHPATDFFDLAGDPGINSANFTGTNCYGGNSGNGCVVLNNNLRWVFTDAIHAHAYGITDYYFMTGDESVRQFLLEWPKASWTNPQLGDNQGSNVISRGLGIRLNWAGRLYEFLSAIGDPAAPSVLTTIDAMIADQIYPTMTSVIQQSGSSAYCSAGSAGMDPNTGDFWGYVPWCQYAGSGGFLTMYPNPPAIGGPNGAGTSRYTSTFLTSILIDGELAYAQSHGQSWNDYWKFLDTAYGNARQVFDNMAVNTGNYLTSRMRYYITLDWPNCSNGVDPGCNVTSSWPNCAIGFEAPNCDIEYHPGAYATLWMPFYINEMVTGDTSQNTFYKLLLQGELVRAGSLPACDECSNYQQNAVVSQINNPPVPLSSVNVSASEIPSGSGNYILSWTVPANCQSYRLKWSSKLLQNSGSLVTTLGFDPMINLTFTLNPNTYQPWFAATNATGIPACGTAGVSQTALVATGIPGLTSNNFSLRSATTTPGGTGGSRLTGSATHSGSTTIQ